ncbi:MAG TPA: ribosome small subunit-dependent GTPase A [Solirubrobacteraceae bacterium]|nr:ribosome small subunit-dependent GTPase A [Solirubrobacteraceae bacterium]
MEDLSSHAPSAGIGRRPDLAAELAELGDPTYTAARVLAQHRGRWLVSDGSDAPPRLVPARGRMRAASERTPSTGDWVALDAHGVIAAVLERRGVVIRRAAGSLVASQLLAANVELVLVVEPLPDPNERRAERIVALAASGGVRAALVLTKADLDPTGAARAPSLATGLGLDDGIAVSVHDPASLAPLDALLEPGTTSVLLGPSGAGKSTLVNALLGYERQTIGAISEHNDGRGRHTTVTRDLVALRSGALLIDTPGIREAGLWDGGVVESFADIEELAARCKFSNCSHNGEPGCVVNAEGDPQRVAAWQKLETEQQWIEDRRAASAARAQRGRGHGHDGWLHDVPRTKTGR